MKPARENELQNVVLSTLAYCTCSITMMFSNKTVLTSYGFKSYPITVLAIQSGIAAFLLHISRVTGVVSFEQFQFEIAKKWLPTSCLFVAMLFTSTKSLGYLSIPTVTVCKNLTNILVAYGDFYLNGQVVSPGILFALVMMVLGSLLAGWTDLEFSLEGYVWMLANCVSTAAYALYIKKAKQDTNLGEWGMAFYNNLLTVGIVFPLCVVSGELINLNDFPYLHDSGFLAALLLSGGVGMALSLATFWCVSATSPTSYSIIGSLNKIPLTVLSFFVFKTALSTSNALSIAFGLFSGIVYSYVKYRANMIKAQQPVP